MFNYIRSELYRFTHTRPVYIITVVCCALVLFMNLLLYFYGGGAEWYTNTSFSYSMLLSSPFILVFMGLIVAASLYENHRKNGNLKNTVAFGVGRVQIFLAQCLAGILTATIMLVIILAVYIGSAELLLANTGSWDAFDLIKSTALVYLIACAGLVTFLVCGQHFHRDLSAGLAWGIPWIVLPLASKYLGFKFSIFADLAGWLPYIYLNNINPSAWWDDPTLIEKSLLCGMIGILVFGLIGVVSLRKKDL